MNYSRDLGPRPELKWLPTGELKIDRNYQRDIVPGHVQRLVAKFRWVNYKPATVTPAPDGGYFVIDGQHEVAAAVAHPFIDELPCYVVSAPETAAQAEAFVAINSQRVGVTPIAVYWAALAAGEEWAQEISSVMETAGVSIMPSLQTPSKPGYTTAVVAIRRAIKVQRAENVARALRFLRTAQPHGVNIFFGTAITGLSRMMYEEGNRIKDGPMTTVLGNVDLHQLRRDAQADRQQFGLSTEAALARRVAMRYNLYIKGSNDPRISEDYGRQEIKTAFSPAAISVAPLPPAAYTPPPKPSRPQVPTGMMVGRPNAPAPKTDHSRSVVPPIPRRTLVCICKREFRPERPGQIKCNICLHPVGA